MSKETAKKATLQDLLEKKLKKEESQNQFRDIYISSMDRCLTFKKPTDDAILDVVEAIGDGTNTRAMVESFTPLIYKCCPMLQDTSLHTELEIKDPFEIVSKLFDIPDIVEIGTELCDFIGVKSKADEIKK